MTQRSESKGWGAERSVPEVKRVASTVVGVVGVAEVVVKDKEDATSSESGAVG